jgi:hypothetical protein
MMMKIGRAVGAKRPAENEKREKIDRIFHPFAEPTPTRPIITNFDMIGAFAYTLYPEPSLVSVFLQGFRTYEWINFGLSQSKSSLQSICM